jgi:hypothetical protein
MQEGIPEELLKKSRACRGFKWAIFHISEKDVHVSEKRVCGAAEVKFSNE